MHCLPYPHISLLHHINIDRPHFGTRLYKVLASYVTCQHNNNTLSNSADIWNGILVICLPFWQWVTCYQTRDKWLSGRNGVRANYLTRQHNNHTSYDFTDTCNRFPVSCLLFFQPWNPIPTSALSFYIPPTRSYPDRHDRQHQHHEYLNNYTFKQHLLCCIWILQLRAFYSSI